MYKVEHKKKKLKFKKKTVKNSKKKKNQNQESFEPIKIILIKLDLTNKKH
jgi:hypothetical protein